MADRLLRAASLLAAALLVFIAGSWVTHRGAFPYRGPLREAFTGVDALLSSRDEPGEEPEPPAPPSWFLRVDAAAPDRAAPGLTLLAVGQAARLVDLDGAVRHEWRVDLRRVLGEGRDAAHGAPVDRVIWRSVRLLPGGDLLVVLDVPRASPYGLALLRLDRDSRPRFLHRGNAHHDLDLAPDGRILVLGQRLRDARVPGLPALAPPMYDELLLELSPAGELLTETSLLEALGRSPYAGIFNREFGRLRYEKGDYLHPNNVDLVDAATAARFPFAREGQVLLSLRELDALALLDRGTGTVSWVRRGEWVRQHDPDFLPNGNLLVFDNRGDLDRRGGTRVIEYDPASRAIVWQFPSAPGHPPLRSPAKGDAQRLPNGNTLVNSFRQGRLFEVTREGEVVWEGRCTIPGAEREPCGIQNATRVPPGELDFPLNGGAVPR